MDKNIKHEKLKKFAFTLAETLVTLTVIGVVMALLLRTINRVNPNKEKLLFLKSYRSIEYSIAEAINDQDRYDQAGFDRDHGSFAVAPYPEYNSTTCGTNVAAGKAVCCFLADSINTIGTVNCDALGAQNFKASNGACFGGWTKAAGSDSYTGWVDPLCEGKNDTKHWVTVTKEGKVTVPATGDGGADNSVAVGWMDDQTSLK